MQDRRALALAAIELQKELEKMDLEMVQERQRLLRKHASKLVGFFQKVY